MVAICAYLFSIAGLQTRQRIQPCWGVSCEKFPFPISPTSLTIQRKPSVRYGPCSSNSIWQPSVGEVKERLKTFWKTVHEHLLRKHKLRSTQNPKSRAINPFDFAQAGQAPALCSQCLKKGIPSSIKWTRTSQATAGAAIWLDLKARA